MSDPGRLHTFKYRLPLLLMLILIITSVAFESYRTFMEQKNAILQEKKIVMAILQAMDASVGAALFRHDISTVESRISSLNSFPDLKSVTVYSTDWRVLAELRKNEKNRLVPSYRYIRHKPDFLTSDSIQCRNQSHLLCIKKVQYAGAALGWLEIDYSLEHIKTHKADDVLKSVVQTGIIVLISLMVLMVYLRGKINDLYRMADFASSMPASPESRLKIRSVESEFRNLAASLNATAAMLEKKQSQEEKNTRELHARNNRLACLFKITGILGNSLYDTTSKLRQVADRIHGALGCGSQYAVELRVQAEENKGMVDNIQGNIIQSGKVSISIVSKLSGSEPEIEISREEKSFLEEVAHKLTDYLSLCGISQDFIIKSSA